MSGCTKSSDQARSWPRCVTPGTRFSSQRRASFDRLAHFTSITVKAPPPVHGQRVRRECDPGHQDVPRHVSRLQRMGVIDDQHSRAEQSHPRLRVDRRWLQQPGHPHPRAGRWSQQPGVSDELAPDFVHPLLHERAGMGRVLRPHALRAGLEHLLGDLLPRQPARWALSRY